MYSYADKSWAEIFKNEIDNNVVQLFKGDNLQGDASMDAEQDLGDIEDDFGGDEDFDEFNADENYGDEDVNLDDLDFGEVEREEK